MAAVTSVIPIGAPTLFASLVAGCVCLWPQVVQGTCDSETISRYPGGWPKVLDANLYWFGPDNKASKATGEPSEYYDPTKNTIILMDGWDGWDKVSTCHRLSTSCPESVQCPDNMIYSRGWLEQGYNVGIFYWDQFADTTCTIDAEALIWDKDSDWRKGPWHEGNKMMWKSYDIDEQERTDHVYSGPESSVGRICSNILRQAMPTFSGKILQVVGLSLGAQLASSCALELHQTPNHPVLPTRLTFLEPIFTDFLKGMSFTCFGRGWDWKYTTRRTMFAIQSLWLRGVPMELYKSSIMTEWPFPFGWNPALEMETLGTVVYYDPQFCGFGLVSYQCRHEAAVLLYFLRMGPPAAECVIPGPTCTELQLKDLIRRQQDNLTDGVHMVFNQKAKGSRVVYTQITGKGTLTPDDDEIVPVVKDLPTDARLPHNASELKDEPVGSWPFHRLVQVSSKGLSEAGRPVLPIASLVIAALFASIVCGCLAMSRLAHARSARSRDCLVPQRLSVTEAYPEDSEDGGRFYE